MPTMSTLRLELLIARANEVPISPVPTIAIVVKGPSAYGLTGSVRKAAVSLSGGISYTIRCPPETGGYCGD